MGKKEIQMYSWEENNIVKSIPIILKIGLNETLTSLESSGLSEMELLFISFQPWRHLGGDL